jgi:anti-sigma factor RsiW
VSRLDCAALAAFVTEYIEQALPKGRARAFERHLARCADCDMYLRQMRQTIELTGRLDAADVEAVPEAVRTQLLAAFRASGSASHAID